MSRLKINTFRRSILLGFLFAASLPLLLLGYFSYTYMSLKIEDAGSQKNELLAETVAAEISANFLEPETILRQIALYLQGKDLSARSVTELLNSVVDESSYLETVYLLDRKKHIQNIGLGSKHRYLTDNFIGNDLSGMLFLKNVAFLEGTEWSNSFLSPVSGKKSIALILPVDKEICYVGLINIDFMHRSISARSTEQDTSVIIVDEKGTTIYHPDLHRIQEQQNFANVTPFLQWQLGTFGTFEMEYGNERFLSSTAHISQAKWLVMVVESYATATEALRNMTRFFLFAVIVSLLVVATVALQQSRKISQPLTDLQNNIRAVADGEYEAELATQPLEEFESVAFRFRRMSSTIKRREQLLELNEERLSSLLEIHELKHLEEGEILSFALEQAVELTRSEIGYLHILDESEVNIRETLWSKRTEGYCRHLEIGIESVQKNQQWLRSATERRSIALNREDRLDSELMRHLTVAIVDENAVVAVVGVFDKENDYDKTDERQLSLYFNHAWDIVQQKRTEKEKGRLAEQLAQAQKLEAIGTLAGGIAHDFNNVLMVIIGNTELAKDNVHQPETLSRDLDEIFNASLRARDLVNQILAFSRHSTEGRKILDIKPIVKEAVKLFRSSIPAHIRVEPDIASDSHPIIAEPGQIKQLIMNLCTNAYQAMDQQKGVLKVSLYPQLLEEDVYSRGKLIVKSGNFMVLTVSDTGCGIAEDMIARIFEPYYSTREKERGTGLGLAVVHGIVKGIKGGIVVESELGKGSQFIVFLPIAKGETRDEKQVISGTLPGGEEHILYVEDDIAVSQVNQKILQSLGYTVSVFCSCQDALAAYSAEPENFDLVITDMTMPEMTGYMLAEKILAIREDFPIILCTGYSENISDELTQQIGIREVMMKPLTKFDLALTIRKVLGYSTRSN